MSPRTPPTQDPAREEVRRRREVVDLARRATRGAGTADQNHLDQDAWVSGRITLDELVALSQGTIADDALTMHQPAAAPTPTQRVAAHGLPVTRSAVSAGEAGMVANDLEVQAVVSATATRAAVAAAATKTLQAAGAARAARSAAAMEIALATAETVRQAAHLLQVDADEDALRLSSAAAEAASLVASAVMPGTEAVNAEKAALLAVTIRATAVAKAEKTALAAATVARAAATAAADAAASAADAAMALELQVADTAAAVQAVATATARRVAVDTVTAADLVLASETRS